MAQVTLSKLLRNATNRLVTSGIEASEAKSSSRIIMKYVLDQSGIQHTTNQIRGNQDLFWKLISMRASRIPLQYILKEWPFYNLKLLMRPPVFIPRPETEELVHSIINVFKNKTGPIVFLGLFQMSVQK